MTLRQGKLKTPRKRLYLGERNGNYMKKKKHINFNSYAKEFEENSDANFSTEGY